MPYVDTAYYKTDFGGTVIPDEELTKALDTASDNIDSLTYNRIVGIGFNNLTAFQQGKVKKAVCLQAEYSYEYGSYSDLPVNSFSIGDINMNLGNNQGLTIKASNAVINLLKQTGLMSRVV